MDDIISQIDAALDEAEPDDFPWSDAARWSPTDQDEPAALLFPAASPIDTDSVVIDHQGRQWYRDPSDPPWLLTAAEPENPEVWEVSRQPPSCYSEEPVAGQTIILRAELRDGREARFVYVHGEDLREGTWSGDTDMLEAVQVLMALDPQPTPLATIAAALARVGWHGTVSDSVWLALAGDDY